MRAIKIDVVEKRIYEVEIDGSLKSMQQAVGCSTITGIRLGPSDYLWIDDEGLLKKEKLGAFKIDYYPDALSGHGLLLGVNRAGENVDTHYSIEEATDDFHFVDISELPEPVITFFNE